MEFQLGARLCAAPQLWRTLLRMQPPLETLHGILPRDEHTLLHTLTSPPFLNAGSLNNNDFDNDASQGLLAAAQPTLELTL